MERSLERRRALQFLAAGLAAACPLCAGASRPAHAEGAHHWSYEGETGPEHWAELEPDFKTCSFGTQQAPIDLRGGIGAQLGEIQPSFAAIPLKILNNGHTIQVNVAEGSYTLIGGQRYELLQFHFHHPSEHLLGGESFPMELHFVHQNAAGQLAVLGVFLIAGAPNAALAPIWDAMPKEATPERTLATTVQPANLLPRGRSYYRYSGSLTTPPCSEGVLWTVFREPIEVSPAQIDAFAALFPGNARPVQPMNRRFLLEWGA